MADLPGKAGANTFARTHGEEPILVGGVAVHAPVTKRQAERVVPLGLLADEPAALLDAWTRVEQMWSLTLTQALRLPAGELDERVNGEWSFLETLRHLVMVTDGWIGGAVQGNPSPYHPLGIPPDFIKDGDRLGLDLVAEPGVDEVLGCRMQRMAQVQDAIRQTTSDELGRMCSSRAGQFTVLGAYQVVIFEEWAHNQYAIRDLTHLVKSL
jgi:hypothetical protein